MEQEQMEQFFLWLGSFLPGLSQDEAIIEECWEMEVLKQLFLERKDWN